MTTITDIPKELWMVHIIPMIGVKAHLPFFWVCKEFKDMISTHIRLYKNSDESILMLIYKAAKDGDLLFLSTFHKREYDWRRILQGAAESGNTTLVEQALQHLPKKKYNIALTSALENGHLQVAKMIYEGNPFVKRDKHEGMKKAAFHGHTDAVEWALDLDAIFVLRSALKAAYRGGRIDTAEMIMIHIKTIVLDLRNVLSPNLLTNVIENGQRESFECILKTRDPGPRRTLFVRNALNLCRYPKDHEFLLYVLDLLELPVSGKYRNLVLVSSILNGDVSVIGEIEWSEYTPSLKDLCTCLFIDRDTNLDILDSLLLNMGSSHRNSRNLEDVIISAMMMGKYEFVEYSIRSELARKYIHNEKSTFSRLLRIASQVGNTDIIELILDTKVCDMATAFIMACSQGKLYIVERLFEEGCDERTLHRGFITACCRNNRPVIRYILSKIDDAEIKQRVLNKGMKSAVAGDNRGAVKYIRTLIDISDRELAYWSSKNLFNNETTRFYLSQALKIDSELERQKILKRIFRGACRVGNLIMVKDLISEEGVNIENGLINACISGDVGTVAFLVEKTTNYINKALIMASASGKVACVEFLLSMGADDLNVALKAACMNRNNKMAIRRLTEEGAGMREEAFAEACKGGHSSLYYDQFADIEKCLNCDASSVDHSRYPLEKTRGRRIIKMLKVHM